MIDLEKIKSNDEIKNLFKRNVLFELWIGKYPTQNGRTLKLLYSMISASPDKEWSNWRSSDFKKILKDIPLNVEESIKCAKLSICVQGPKVELIISEMLNGKNVKDSANFSKVPSPPSNFADLVLGLNNDPQKEFYIRPPIYGMTKNILNSLTPSRKGVASPITNSTCIIGSLVRLNKDVFWQSESGEPLRNGKNVINSLSSYLQSETSIPFQQSDIKRLGNIEWVAYPSLNIKEISHCNTSTIKKAVDEKTGKELEGVSDQYVSKIISCSGLSIEISGDRKLEGCELIIQCSAFNDEDLVGDKVKKLIYKNEVSVSFNFQEQVSGGEFRVWKKAKKCEEYLLYHKEKFDLIRSFNIDMSFANVFSSIPKSEWLDKLLQDDSPAPRPKTHLSEYTLKFDKNYNLDPWNPVSKNIKTLMQRLNPKPSNGSFLLSKDGDDEKRKQEISSWIKTTCKRHSAATFVFLDPFFDTFGIECLCCLDSLETELIIVTNTQSSSFDDDLGLRDALTLSLSPLKKYFKINNNKRALSLLQRVSNAIKPENDTNKSNREKRILTHCQSNDELLRNNGVRILDLKRISQGSKQIFHDRYALFFNKDGRLEAGYNFSNSVQGAMGRFPLLITPIPIDLLEPLQNYIHEFILGNIKSRSRRVDVIYTTHNSQEQLKQEKAVKQGVNIFKRPSLFFSELLSENSILRMDEKSLKSYLETNGFIKNETGFIFPKDHPSLLTLKQKLEKMSEKDFFNFWEDFSEYLAHINNPECFFEIIKGSSKLQKDIRHFIVNYASNISLKLKDKNYKNFKNHLDGFRSGEIRNLSDCAMEFTRYGSSVRFYIGLYSISMSISALSSASLEELIKLYEKLEAKEDFEDIDYFIMASILDKLHIHTHFHPENLDKTRDVMCSSQSLAVKIIYAMSYYGTFDVEKDEIEYNWMKQCFTPSQIIQVTSKWVYDLRVMANRKGEIESEGIERTRRKLFSYMIKFWDSTQLNLKEIISNCSGPTYGSWSTSNYEELAHPLLQNSKITNDDLVDTWVTPLIEKIKKLEAGEAHFYERTDSGITAVAVHILIGLSSEEKRDILKEFSSLLKRTENQLRRPRLKTTDYSLWNNNLNVFVWLDAILRHFLFYENVIQKEEFDLALQYISPFLQTAEEVVWSQLDGKISEHNYLLSWGWNVREKAANQNNKNIKDKGINYGRFN